MTPRRFVVLIEPPAIGNVNVVPDAVAGPSAVTVMWLSESTFAAASEAVIWVVPPVIFVGLAEATPGRTRANVVIAAATTRIRIIELPSVWSESSAKTRMFRRSCGRGLGVTRADAVRRRSD